MIVSGQSYPIGKMSMINDIIRKGAESRRQKMEARKTADSSMNDTYKFLQDSSISNADLTGKNKSIDEATKNNVLDNLF